MSTGATRAARRCVWCGEVALDLRDLTFTTPHPLRPLTVEQRLAVCARHEPDLRRYKARERRMARVVPLLVLLAMASVIAGFALGSPMPAIVSLVGLPLLLAAQPLVSLERQAQGEIASAVRVLRLLAIPPVLVGLALAAVELRIP